MLEQVTIDATKTSIENLGVQVEGAMRTAKSVEFVGFEKQVLQPHVDELQNAGYAVVIS
jgi:hypothetical protein